MAKRRTGAATPRPAAESNGSSNGHAVAPYSTWADGPDPITVSKLERIAEQIRRFTAATSARYGGRRAHNAEVTANQPYGLVDRRVSAEMDDRRDYDDECGWPKDPTPEDYYNLFKRNSYAARVVEVLARESWQVNPLVYETEDDVVTPFEEAWDQLGPSLMSNYGVEGLGGLYKGEEGNPIWEACRRADELCGIGTFGVLYLGIDDGKDPREPAEPTEGPREVGGPKALEGEDLFGEDRVEEGEPPAGAGDEAEADLEEEEDLFDEEAGAETPPKRKKKPPVGNVYCPNGPGGGVDPSCSSDEGGDVEVLSSGPNYLSAVKTPIGDYLFSATRGKSEIVGGGGSVYGVLFKARRSEVGYDPEAFNVTGKAGAKALGVMRAIGRAMDKFIEEERPKKIEFSSKVREESRTSLYDRVAPILAKRHGYNLTREEQGPKEGRTVIYQLTRRAGKPPTNNRSFGYEFNLLTFNAPFPPKRPTDEGDATDEQARPKGELNPPESKLAKDGEQQPAEEAPREFEGGRKLLYVRAVPEPLVRVAELENDRKNPRYGQPKLYNITLTDPESASRSVMGADTTEIAVHWTRVVHVADCLESSEVFGAPRLRPVVNDVLDLRKVRGGAAEGFWQSCIPDIFFSTHESLGGDVEIDEPSMRDVMEQMRNSAQRWAILRGMNAQTLGLNAPDPTPQVELAIEAICIKIGCPVRVFKGSERGELASSQDDAAWNDRLKARQRNHLTPRLIVPLVERLVWLGCLPRPKQFYVDWPDLTSQTALEQAQVAAAKVGAAAAFISGGVEAIIPTQKFLAGMLGYTEDEAESMIEEGLAAQEERAAADMEAQQELIDRGLAPDPQQEMDLKMKAAEKGLPPGMVAGGPPGLGGPKGPPQLGGKPPGSVPPKPGAKKPPPFARNAFCPTGEGGGVDPSCSPDDSRHVSRALDQIDRAVSVGESGGEKKQGNYVRVDAFAGNDVPSSSEITSINDKADGAKRDRVEEVDYNDLTFTQDVVERETLREIVKSGRVRDDKPVKVFEDSDGTKYLLDGHTRTVAAMLLERGTISAAILRRPDDEVADNSFVANVVRELPSVFCPTGPGGGQDNDRFGELRGTRNVYCPNGPGGGKDPTCSPRGYIDSGEREPNPLPRVAPEVEAKIEEALAKDRGSDSLKDYLTYAATEESVSIETLRSPQSVNDPNVVQYFKNNPDEIESGKLPLVIQYGGLMFLRDGNSRTVAAMQMGRDKIKARVVYVSPE